MNLSNRFLRTVAMCVIGFAVASHATADAVDETEATYQKLLQCSVLEDYAERVAAPEKKEKHREAIDAMHAHAKSLKPSLNTGQFDQAVKDKEAEMLKKIRSVPADQVNEVAADLGSGCDFAAAMSLIRQNQ